MKEFEVDATDLEGQICELRTRVTAGERLSPETRARRALYRRSILDRTRESPQKLVSDLGASDRRKIDEYLTAIREVEKRIAGAENDTRVPPVDKPSDKLDLNA